MSDGTSIEWTDASWNPVRASHWVPVAGVGEDSDLGDMKLGWHCEHVSPGCANCYAGPINRRLGTGLEYKPGHRGEISIFVDDKALQHPLRWRRPRRIFVGSMTDLFADFVTDAMLDRIFAVMALCPQHTFQLLTKRPERMRAYLHGSDLLARLADSVMVRYDPDEPLAPHRTGLAWADGRGSAWGVHRAIQGMQAQVHPWPLPNVWLGVSVEDQRRADERIPILLDTPAAIRWISAEPLLGPVDLSGIRRFAEAPKEFIDCLTGRFWTDNSGNPNPDPSWAWPGRLPLDDDREILDRHLDWVVVGGESGPGARPMHPDWARGLRDQCAAAGVPFLFKQWGAWSAELDRDKDDPDWRAPYSGKYDDGRDDIAWLNLAGGRGFHGERFHIMKRVGKKAAGRVLDGVTHDAFPEARHG